MFSASLGSEAIYQPLSSELLNFVHVPRICRICQFSLPSSIIYEAMKWVPKSGTKPQVLCALNMFQPAKQNRSQFNSISSPHRNMYPVGKIWWNFSPPRAGISTGCLRGSAPDFATNLFGVWRGPFFGRHHGQPNSALFGCPTHRDRPPRLEKCWRGLQLCIVPSGL